MTGPEIISMGCRLNIAEGEAMRGLLAGRDDVIVINSCAVTNEAVRQTRQAIRKARKARPDAQVIVTGCAAQTDPAMFASMPEVDRVLGNVEKLEAGSFPLRLPPMNLAPLIRLSLMNLAPPSVCPERSRGILHTTSLDFPAEPGSLP